MKQFRIIFIYANYIRTIPTWLFIHCCKYREKCMEDVREYLNHSAYKESKIGLFTLSKLLLEEKSIRNVLLNRLHRNPVLYVLFRILFKPLDTLYINMPPENIGGGLSFQHGFSTIVAAENIGKNCRTYQQVTIGFNGTRSPIIEDGCRICCGAKVIGGVVLHSGCVVGAGSVVVKDVSQDAIVVGVPAKEIHKDYR